MTLTRNAGATQQRLMDAALSLYAERGYAGTCLDAILQRASSSKGAFYHHFESKEELTAKALENHWQLFTAAVADAWAEQQGAEEKLFCLVELLMPSEGEDALACPLGLLGFESRSLPERVRRALAVGLEHWSTHLALRLTALGVRDEAQARLLAQQLFLVYEGGVLIERVIGCGHALAAALGAWCEDVLRALETP